jgi:hypothetical protein
MTKPAQEDGEGVGASAEAAEPASSEGKQVATPAVPAPATDDYKVGPGRPPIGSRYPKGVSGNPSGRRKRVEDFWDIPRDVAYSKVAVKGHGQVARIRVLLMQAFADASKGDKRARAECIALMMRYSPPPNPTNDNNEANAAANRELIEAFVESVRANHRGRDHDGDQ